MVIVLFTVSNMIISTLSQVLVHPGVSMSDTQLLVLISVSHADPPLLR